MTSKLIVTQMKPSRRTYDTVTFSSYESTAFSVIATRIHQTKAIIMETCGQHGSRAQYCRGLGRTSVISQFLDQEFFADHPDSDFFIASEKLHDVTHLERSTPVLNVDNYEFYVTTPEETIILNLMGYGHLQVFNMRDLTENELAPLGGLANTVIYRKNDYYVPNMPYL